MLWNALADKRDAPETISVTRRRTYFEQYVNLARFVCPKRYREIGFRFLRCICGVGMPHYICSRSIFFYTAHLEQCTELGWLDGLDPLS
mgnify:CR=1 FL=1